MSSRSTQRGDGPGTPVSVTAWLISSESRALPLLTASGRPHSSRVRRVEQVDALERLLRRVRHDLDAELPLRGYAPDSMASARSCRSRSCWPGRPRDPASDDPALVRSLAAALLIPPW